MFNRLFKPRTAASPSQQEPKPGPQLAMPAFKTLNPPSVQEVVQAWAQHFPSERPLVGKGDQSGTTGPSVLEFSVPGYKSTSVMLAFMPAPIPHGDVESAVQASWMWPDAAAEMASHHSHAVVMALPSDNAVGDAVAISRVIAAVAAATPTAGVYWGNGGHVHAPAFFIDAVTTMTQKDWLPVLLWIGLRISAAGREGPFTLTTRGLSAFGHLEIEIIDASRTGVGDLRILGFDICNYLLLNGPVLKHGQTFGRSEQERLRIEHTTSRFRPGEPVIRLHVP